MVVPPWIPPRQNESLPDYAARMAEGVKVSRDSRLILGGVSFGGMLACEMSRHLKPDAVVLIASCRDPRALGVLYRSGHVLLPLLPVQFWGLAKLLASPATRLRRRSFAERDVIVRMFRESDSRFMHWVLRAILRWEPTPLEAVRVLQIHGRRDLLISARRVNADQVIPDGGHIINVTHAKAVNAFLRNACGVS
jgi:pimeloyl-ACP methyl ester carboxylesterase